MKRLAFVLAACAVAALPALAQDSLEIAKRRELEEIQRQARQNREAAQQLKKQESGALTTLRRTDRRLNDVRYRLRNLQGQRKRLDLQIEINEVNLDRSRQTLVQLRARLAKRLRSMFKSGAGRDLEFLLSTQSFGQLLARWDFLVMVAEQDRLLLDNVRVECADLTAPTIQPIVDNNDGTYTVTVRSTLPMRSDVHCLWETPTDAAVTVVGQVPTVFTPNVP